MSKTSNTVAVLFAMALAIGGYGTAAVMFNNLLPPWWIPVGYAFALSLLSFVLMPNLCRAVTGGVNKWANGIVQLIIGTAVFSSSITLVNQIGVSSLPADSVEVEIVKAYQTTHYTSRRIRRNTYVKGSPYQMYHLVLRFPGGKEKEITVPNSAYTQFSRRHTVAVTLTKGRLGMDIIRGL